MVSLIDELLGPPPKSKPLGVFAYLQELEDIQNLIGMPVVWAPLPGSQELAVTSPADVTLYEGTRGPGKTDAQLMAFRRHVGKGYGRHWRGVIFDQKYKNLDDLISKTKRWFPEFHDGARFLGSSQLKWVWPTGEELLFRHMDRDSHYWNYHGQEFPFIGWNELTKYPSPDMFDAMMSCNRSSFIPSKHGPDLPEIPLVIFATTNPFGPGHNWVKARFIDEAPPGVIVRKKTTVFNPRTQEKETFTRKQVRIFGSYKENVFLSPQYVAELESITDENKRRAWIWGDWDIVAGGAFDDVYDRAYNVVPRFRIPQGWKVDRSHDWGSTRPFSNGWWGEANGEEVELPVPFRGSTTFCPPKGSLILCHEWYGTKALGLNKGLKMSARKVGEGVVERDRELVKGGWVPSVVPGPADNSIFSVNEEEFGCIADLMAKEGCKWTRSDKSKGSRKNGLQLMRDGFENAQKREAPGIFIMEHCVPFTTLVPVLPRDEDDPDDVDTTAEDHNYDMARYRVLASAPNFLETPLEFLQAH
jgi:hypothetical protein